jgi:putative transposase
LIIRKSFKFRLKPNNQQIDIFIKFAGCSRFVWNKALAKVKQRLNFRTKYPGYKYTCDLLTSWKKEPWLLFLKEANAQSLQQSLKNLDRAIWDCFKKSKKFPRFKRKDCGDSFKVPQAFKINSNKVYLPKIGWIRFKKSREITGTPKNVTVSRRNNHWYVSIQTENEVPTPIHPSKSSIGIDVGITRFATLSDGEFFQPINSFKRLEKKFARSQRSLSRKKKGSSNRTKQKLRVAKIHEKITNVRNDYLHKLSTAICKNHAVVVVEALKIKSMSTSRNHILNRAILDQGWGEFRRQLKYKQEWLGGKLIQVNPAFTSQTCSECGCIDPNNRKTQADFICQDCNHKIHADLNAALNILRAGQALLACGDGTFGSSVKQESSL